MRLLKTCLCCVSVSLQPSWQPERQLPFSDVRLPPPTDYHKDIGEGEEVEVRPAVSHLSLICFSRCKLLPRTFTVRRLTGLLQGQRTGAMWLVARPGPDDEGRGNFIAEADDWGGKKKKKKSFLLWTQVFSSWIWILVHQFYFLGLLCPAESYFSHTVLFLHTDLCLNGFAPTSV